MFLQSLFFCAFLMVYVGLYIYSLNLAINFAKAAVKEYGSKDKLATFLWSSTLLVVFSFGCRVIYDVFNFFEVI
jgi:hypothetical protein